MTCVGQVKYGYFLEHNLLHGKARSIYFKENIGYNSLTKRCKHHCGSNQESKKQSIDKKTKSCPLGEPP